jgi:ABC-type sugar transport system permease subunit
MFVFGIFQVPIMLGLALAFALLLDSGSARFKYLFRLGYFLPCAIPSVIAALLWGLWGADTRIAVNQRTQLAVLRPHHLHHRHPSRGGIFYA